MDEDFSNGTGWFFSGDDITSFPPTTSGGDSYALWTFTDTTNKHIINTNSGNVGVGTSPSHALDVNGTIRGTRVLGVDYGDLTNVPTPETDPGNFFVSSSGTILNKTNYNGLQIRGTQLLISTSTADATAESLFDTFRLDHDDNAAMSILANVINPRLDWRGFAPTGFTNDETNRVSIVTLTIVDEFGRTNWNHLKNLPEWVSTIQSDANTGKALGAVGLALGALASFYGIGSSGLAGFFGDVANGFANIGKGIYEGVQRLRGEGNPPPPADDGGNDEQKLIPWKTIGDRPFWTTPVGLAGVGGKVGFNDDIWVVNESVLGVANEMRILTRTSDNVTTNQANNFTLLTGALSDSYLLIDFKRRHIFCEKLRTPLLQIREDGAIRFYKEGALTNDDDNFIDVLTLKKTQHGDWKLTDKGLFHMGNVVISYDSSANIYTFHGRASGETLTEDQQTSQKPPETKAQKLKRYIKDRFGNQSEIQPADGSEVQGGGSRAERLIQAAERDNVALAQRNAELEQYNARLQQQMAQSRRDQAVKDVNKGFKRFSQNLKSKAKEFNEGLQRMVKYPQETLVKIRNSVKNAPGRIRDSRDVAAARAGDYLKIGALY